jgi:uncharacterized membrane protein (UPF0127 family)
VKLRRAQYIAALLTAFLCSIPFARAEDPACITAHVHKGSAPAHARLKLETATTPEQRARGLMHRTRIGPCDGMAFFFPAQPDSSGHGFKPQQFWMKNTHIPLDIIFISPERRIVEIVQGTPLQEAPVGAGNIPILSVIEIDAGRAARETITVGDFVTYDVSKPIETLGR